jgi:hypothetical protein
MTPCRDLLVLRSRALNYLNRLRELGSDAAVSFPDRGAKLTIGHVTIELQNTWSLFARSYILSWTLTPRRATGGRIRIGKPVSDFNNAITLLNARHKPHLTVPISGTWHRRDEPPWHDPQVILTSCLDLGCSHSTQVQAAFSLSTAVFQHLPVFRNFFGHRNLGTANAARQIAPQYSIPSYLHPVEILLRKPAGRPYPLVLDWVDDIATTIELLCD